MKKTPEVSLKTLAEQAAGRNEIEKAVHYELLLKHDLALKKKFPTYLGNPHLSFDTEFDEWMVEVRMQTATGSFINFKEPFLGFPSDQLIANMVLVEP